MSYDLTEIKKLSTEEKLQIIDELWETIESDRENGKDTFEEDPEVISLLQELIEKYERGEGVFYSVEDSMRIIKERLEDFRNSKNV